WQVLLRDFHVAVGRCVPADQRRTAHAIPAGLLSITTDVELAVSPHSGWGCGAGRAVVLPCAASGRLLHDEVGFLKRSGKWSVVSDQWSVISGQCNRRLCRSRGKMAGLISSGIRSKY